MKHLILLAMLQVSFVASHAQVHQVYTTPHTPLSINKLYTTGRAVAVRPSASVQVPGRTVNYRWDAATNRWSNGEVVTATYNTIGYPISELTADSATNQPIRRLTSTFIAPSQPLSTTTESWNGSAWQNSYRTLNSYDKSQGKITEWLSQRWSSGAWQNINRTVFAYNRYATDTIILNQDWVNNGWVTQPTSSQSSIVYNSSGQHIEVYRNYFDVNTNGFKPYNKSVYIYSSVAAKNPVEEIEMVLQNGVYINNARFVIDYNAQLQVIKQEKQTWVNGVWLPVQQIAYSYLTNSPGYSYIIQQYQSSGWVNDVSVTNSFDAYGNQNGYLYELWKNGAWETQIDDRRLLRYDANNNVIRNVRQVFNIHNATTRGFVNESLSTYGNYRQITLDIRSNTNLVDNTVVYPNPANGVITVATPDYTGPVENIDVINNLGQIVYTYTFKRDSGQRNYQLDLRQLPSGTYNLRVQMPKGVAMKRIVLQ